MNDFFKGKKVTVVGLARSGQAAAALLDKVGARVKISEKAPMESFPPEFQNWLKEKKISCEFQGHSQGFVEDSDLVVVSPGVRVDAPPLVWARGKGIPVWSEIELSSRLCPCPMIAVTGSNGKTTTVTLITEVLKAAGKNARLCGNVGFPFAQYVLDLSPRDYAVLEISSFQLETIASFKPHVAVWTNFGQNHLDRHKDLDEYFQAKKRIFLNQDANDFAVLNARDQMVAALAGELKAKVFLFDYPGHSQEESIKNPNYLATAQVAKILGVPREVYQKVFAEFRGVEHRLERVRTLEGVVYINDSKDTTVESGRWALQNLDVPIVMICGGRDKNLDYTVLRDLAKKKVKAMVVIGEAREKLKKAFTGFVRVEDGGTDLGAAVDLARKLARPGDCVVLSPMCASFDMFKNYEERGRIFKKIVQDLA